MKHQQSKFWLTFLCLAQLSATSEAHLFPPPHSVDELILDITLANTNRENDMIDLGGRTFYIASVNNDRGNGPNGLPVIQPDLAVSTPHSLTIKNGKIEISLLSGIQSRHIEVAQGASLFLENVTLKYGSIRVASENGGSILNFGSLSLKEVALLHNTALAQSPGCTGGAIFNAGTLSVGDSTFAYNAALLGGAIFNEGIILQLFNSTFAFNNADNGQGGAIYTGFPSGGIMSMTNNTIALNTAANGGGIINYGFINMFTSNIVAANIATTNAPDINNSVGGSINNPQYNLIGTSANNGITATGNNIVQTGVDPVDPGLEALSYNGGHTWTMALLPTSLAINAGYNPFALRFDERGHGYSRTSGGATDIGAFELQLCERDSDEDGVCNENDNCPCRFNPDQDDCNHNGVGDACDPCPCPCDREPCDDTCGPCPPHHEPGPCDPDDCHRHPHDGDDRDSTIGRQSM